MYIIVACRIDLFTSNGNFLSPYKRICKRVELGTSVRSKERSTGVYLPGHQVKSHDFRHSGCISTLSPFPIGMSFCKVWNEIVLSTSFSHLWWLFVMVPKVPITIGITLTSLQFHNICNSHFRSWYRLIFNL